MVSNKEKPLPSLPFFNKSNSNDSSNNSKSKSSCFSPISAFFSKHTTKFTTWFSKKFPKASEFFKKYKMAFLILLILLLIALLIIIIIAAVGGFSRDDGEPGIDMNGKGDGTYYDPGVGIGACGWQNYDHEFVAALNAPQYGKFANPADSPICGKCIKVTGPKGSVNVKLVDKCPICKHGDIDMTTKAFEKIADIDDGRVKITWEGCYLQAASKSLIN